MTSTNQTVDNFIIADLSLEVVAILILLLLSMLGCVLMILFLFYFVAYHAYVKWKSYRKGPITLTPVIPFPQDSLRIFRGSNLFKNVVPDAKIQYDEKAKKPAIRFNFWKKEYDYYLPLNQFMSSTFKLHNHLPHEYQQVPNNTGKILFMIKPKLSVPSGARTISIKMDGFEHGEKCHDFVPIGGAAPGSHFTYQMYGDNRIQVTRYVVDGKSEIAGFRIYFEHRWLSTEEYRWALLYQMARSVKISTKSETAGKKRNKTNQPKIEVIPDESTKLIGFESNNGDQEWTVKFCSKLQRKVMTSIDSGGVVVHQEWIQKNNQMRIERCEECTEEGLEKEEQPPTYSSIFDA